MIARKGMRFALAGLVVGVLIGLALPMEKLEAQRGQSATLRSDQIRTRYLMNGSVTSSKLALSAVTVTVAMGAPSGSSAAAPTLVGGSILGIVPAGNQDQLVDNVVLNGDGSVTVTIAANATAANTFSVKVIKGNLFGVQ